MQFLRHMWKMYLIGFIGMTAAFSHAAETMPYSFCQVQFQEQTQKEIEQIYVTPNLPTTLPERIHYFSHLFLNKPYALTALGEGPQGQFDQAPLYRFDAFDCQTYVETVLALALSNSAPQFKQCINHFRYANGKVDYIQRHHFTSPDWNAFNQEQGFLQDITDQIINQHHQHISRYAATTIDQANWYQHFDPSKIRLCIATQDLNQQRLNQLRQLGKALPNKKSHIAYIPIQALTSKDKHSQYLLDQIPSGAIIEIVRPNWDLTKLIGTHLNVSHIGFAIREKGILYFYQASSLENKVYKIPLEDYLISMLAQPTIQGINIQVVSSSTYSAQF